MTGALIILAALVVIGALLYITDVKYFRHHGHGETIGKSQNDTYGNTQPNSSANADEICCGMHLICEKTSLSITSDEIVYYDDEELDRFAGRLPEEYSPAEIEEFRDILMTLLPQDVAGWARSVTLRHIELPSEIKDELLLLVSELRDNPNPI